MSTCIGNRQGVRVFLGVMMLAVIAFGLAASVCSAASASKPSSTLMAQCKTDLAKRLKVKAESIKLFQSQPVTWPDAALGMPESGKMYAQVLTPGFRIILQAENQKYLYVASAKVFKYAGPVDTWAYSVLYTKPIPNNANLNCDLYQCSWVGTNIARIATGVSDFYPQDKGVVIVKRRTSRSGHDLLFVKADGKMKETPLYKAFDFNSASMNSAQTEWAACVRPRVGGKWEVIIARGGAKHEDVKTFPLPEGVNSARVAWSGENLMILANKGEGLGCYEISPKAANPEWAAAGPYDFPGLTDYMLNKSQTLDITQLTENGKPVVEVAKVWFTGDRDVVAKIPGLSMRGQDLIWGYAFVWGDKGSSQASYAADLSSGLVVTGFQGKCQDLKPFRYPPLHAPIAAPKPN